MKRNKPIFRRDCRFLESEQRCTAYKGKETFLISCGKDCPFFEKSPVKEKGK